MNEVWSKADLHIHSNHSDGLAKIPEIMEYVATKTDISVIAITDHNTIEGALFAQSLQEMYGIEVVVGEEISSKSGHIIGLWLQEAIPPNLSAAETVSRINEQGGIAVIAHPFANRAFGPFGLESVGQAIYDVAFHALEVYNSSPYLIYANRLAAKAFAGGQGVAATGGSDAHVLKAVGKGYTLFRGRTAADLRLSIENLETRAEAARGGLSVALRYAFRYPQIRRLQAWNWERCKATK
ncbi:MAG: phosphotransferase [Actinobacteria bacterium HGW-Actinobacteria-1]|nr:MAG: phosphotransferase [Actinobacteria bacterium HGW-Actinobacteria-1]